MKRRTLVLRGLIYYWRTNAAVVLGVATGVAVLAGALIVGDSVRGSLRDLVLQRLGRVDHVVLSSEFFREALAGDLERDASFAAAFQAVSPVIIMPGLVTDQASGRRVSQVQVYGVDDRFWRLHGVAGASGPADRDALLSRALASELGTAAGGTVLVRVERPSAIPIESLTGRKDNLGRTLRLTVRAVVAAADGGDFTLQPQQGEVRAVFVPLARLQQDLDVAGRVNALLVSDRSNRTGESTASGERPAGGELEALIRRRFALEDVGLTVRVIAPPDATVVIAVESPASLIDQTRARAAEEAATAAGMTARSVLTYLANTIRSGDRQVPYSLVTAMDLRTIAPDASPARPTGGAPPIVVNDWTARDLGVQVGDSVTLDYYVWEDPGRLLTRTADFQVAAIVPIAGAAADRDLAPVYPGITAAKTLADWDPPFPVDLRRVRQVDEDYWAKYRTTPKAFVPLDVGRRLWGSRFGDRTSVRVVPVEGSSPDGAVSRFGDALRSRIDPIAAGLAVRAVRSDSLAASRGATDFGEYFAYFSFFLVVSALLLAALFFRLSVEQRAREVGLLRAVGFSTAQVRRLFSTEGFILALAGSALGVAGAVAYGGLMMAGLRTWWSGAVGTRALYLHVAPASLAAGAAGALAMSTLCIWWSLRSLSRISERSLLAGNVAPSSDAPRRVRVPALAAGAGFAALGAALIAASAAGVVDRAGAFFGAGSALLLACLFGVAFWLRRPTRSVLEGHGWRPLGRIGLRNAANRPGRSVLAIGVIASATFILISVDAFRREAPPVADQHSGVGGYPLLVDLLVPLVNDPNGPDGLEALGLRAGDGVTVAPFRVLPGDDASCLNLYEPRNPRILGVSRPFVESGRFAFQSSIAASESERVNPWRLLDRDLGTDTVPVIADANSMTYVLHKALGQDVVITSGGRPIRLRLVAALADSIFQGELLMSDANFARLFPEQQGYRFLLVETPADRVAQTASAIEDGASDLGADAVETQARLAEFHAVENTYLSTFQTLGGLGLLVGTVGLAAVLLRNVLERRRELALLGAVGYRRGHIFAIVVAENLALLAWGLAIGAVCAAIAIAPAVAERGGRLPATGSGALLLAGVFLAGLVSSILATRAALGTPLLDALRSE